MMSNRTMRVLALTLAMLVIGGLALAEVRATGDLWMRTGPGRNYDAVGDFKSGHVFEYLGETQMDERPVAWYKVSSNGKTGWVSSKYAELVDEEETEPMAGTSEADETQESQDEGEAGLPALNAGELFVDSFDQEPEGDAPVDATKEAVELSRYYRGDLVASALKRHIERRLRRGLFFKKGRAES